MSPALLTALIQFAAQYGIPAALKIIEELKKPEPTVASIEEIFRGVKPYDAYGIPDVVPAKPVP